MGGLTYRGRFLTCQMYVSKVVFDREVVRIEALLVIAVDRRLQRRSRIEKYHLK